MSWRGTLNIDVFSASNVPIADVGGLADPYVVIHYAKEKKKTRYIVQNLSPVWNERL